MGVDTEQLARAAAARIGQRIDGRYALQSVLGVGGMGAVYVALHRFTDRRVALKILHPRHAKGANLKRFLQEAKAAAHIAHPRVAPVLDAGQTEEGTLFMAMELLEGEDLGAAIRARRLTPEHLKQVGLQILDALDAAHDKGFVHRDIKPGNIFLRGRPEDPVDAWLLDFGIARRLAAGANRLTQAGAVVGTPYFMSPEQMCGEAVDGRADLWALGVVMFYALTGSLPFRAEGYVGLLKEMLDSGPPSPRVLRPEISPGLSDFVVRALAPHIEDRFASAGQMRGALEALEVPAGPAPSRSPRVGAAPVPAPEATPRRRGPATERPPAWSSALEAIEAEISSLEAPEPEAPPKAGWLSRLRRK